MRSTRKLIIYSSIFIVIFSFGVGCSNSTDILSQTNSKLKNEMKDNMIRQDSSLESWVGDYQFSEFAPPDENMFYSITIFKEEGSYYAKINIDGFQTIRRVRAKVVGDQKSIKLMFEKYLPDNISESYKKGDILIILNKKDLELHTTWGKIGPMILSNYKPAQIYFTKRVNSSKSLIEEKNPNKLQKINTSNDMEYRVNGLVYSKSDDKLKCVIRYPQITGLNDKYMQNKINNTLKDEATKVLKYYENPYGSVELNIDYKVTSKKSNIFSVQYSGSGSVSNAAHPNNLFFTTNINMKTGNRLRLNDVLNIDKNFANKFLSGEFRALWPEHSKALKHFTHEEIQELFKEADSLDNIGTEKQSDVFSYYTTDSLGVSISVGHAIGDHAEFEVKYTDIAFNIKEPNLIHQ